MTSSRTSLRELWFPLVAVCATNAALLWFFHNRYWYPTDDGFYAHIAERLLSGEVLNRDVQDIHPGYVHVLHVIAFRLFGMDLVSLRYPMIAAAFVEAVVVFIMLRARGVLLAVGGSLAVTALGIVQFMSPNPSWYCAALAVLLAWWLTAAPAGRARLVGAGVILGTLTLFRHLTGIWVAMGVIAFVLIERSTNGRGRQLVLMRLQIAIMLVALVGYLYWNPDTEPGGLMFMGAWPVAVFGWMLFNTRTRNADAAAAIGQLLAGTIIAAAPLILYYVWNRSVHVLLHDLIVVASAETELDFYGRGWFGLLPLAGFYQAVSSFDIVRTVNGLYWTVLPLISAVNGLLLLRALRKRVDVRMLALPLVAVFYAVVALQYEGPLYLYYIVGLSLTSVLWLLPITASVGRIAAATVAGLSTVALIFHAGQSRERTPAQILRGERVTQFGELTDCGVPRCSLTISATDAGVYQTLVGMIRTETRPNESILAIPNDAELYFLSERRNPTPFYNAAHGTTTEEQRQNVFRVLSEMPPRLVTFRPDDKYNNEATAEIMRRVRADYRLLGKEHALEVYRLPSAR
jgi:hypothetical protein